MSNIVIKPKWKIFLKILFLTSIFFGDFVDVILAK